MMNLPEESKVILTVYDILGREVTRLINNKIMEKGRHKAKWNAANLSSGIYLIKLKSDKFEKVIKAVLLK